MDNVRIGVIGVGGMGSAHCKQIAEGNIRGMTLTAVAMIKESRENGQKKIFRRRYIYMIMLNPLWIRETWTQYL